MLTQEVQFWANVESKNAGQCRVDPLEKAAFALKFKATMSLLFKFLIGCIVLLSMKQTVTRVIDEFQLFPDTKVIDNLYSAKSQMPVPVPLAVVGFEAMELLYGGARDNSSQCVHQDIDAAPAEAAVPGRGSFSLPSYSSSTAHLFSFWALNEYRKS